MPSSQGIFAESWKSDQCSKTSGQWNEHATFVHKFIDTTAVLSSPLPTDSSHPYYRSRHLGTFLRRSYSSPRRTDPTSYKTSQATWTHFQSSWHSSELRLSRPIDSCYSRQLSPDFRLSKTISRTPVSEMIVVLRRRYPSIIDSCHIVSQVLGNFPQSLDQGLVSKRKNIRKTRSPFRLDLA